MGGPATEPASGVGMLQSVSDWPRGLMDRVIDDTAIARAREYALLAALLARPPDAPLLKRLAKIESDSTPLGVAHQVLTEVAAAKDAAAVAREYFDLFVGVGRGQLLPYGSYYLTGFLHERPLARLRTDLVDLGIERIDGQCEPEDHAAFLCEIMAVLVAGEFAAPVERQRFFFDRHLAPWIARFFADLEAAKAANFYHPVGAIGRLFIEIEAAAFTLPG
jgi:TorA maturation chaperone TorD